MKKKDDHLFARLDKRFYTILTALILIGFVIALVIMFSRILFIADNTEIDSEQPYKAQHAEIPVTLKELGILRRRGREHRERRKFRLRVRHHLSVRKSVLSRGRQL